MNAVKVIRFFDGSHQKKDLRGFLKSLSFLVPFCESIVVVKAVSNHILNIYKRQNTFPAFVKISMASFSILRTSLMHSGFRLV